MQTKELQIYKLSKFSVAGIRTRVAQRAAIHYIKSWKTQPWIQKVQNFFPLPTLKCQVTKIYLQYFFRKPWHISDWKNTVQGSNIVFKA